MDLIDTHIHLLHPDRFTYAWCAGNPALQGRFGLEEYRAQAAKAKGRARVRGMMFMEADVPAEQQAAETEFFARLADKDRGTPPLIALIAGAAPESADFPNQLAQIGAEARVRGLRRVLHTQPDAVLQSSLLAENLRRLPAAGLAFDLCVRPRQLALVTALVTDCPQTQFVLDHCGAPDLAGGELDLWREGIRELAQRPNVACKFSGLGSLADATKPLTPQVQPVFAHCLDCFYPERMLWGSDWPVSADLKAWVETTVELLAPLSEHEQIAIGSGNIGRIYGMN
jgi:predicted TIM-barrel fold metal-dependent hydrolase